MTSKRLFDPMSAFEHPAVAWFTIACVAVLVVAWGATFALSAMGRIGPSLRRELVLRNASWSVLLPILVGPILLGPAWVMGLFYVVSILCYREYARATGIFRHRRLSAVVALGITAVTFAIADHWYGLFVALGPLTMVGLAIVAITNDQPRGYLQRVALCMFAFTLFGMGLGHAGYLANDDLYRPLLLWLIICVQANDVFAFITGKLFGKRKLAPATSPNKTLGGALGAMLLTTALAASTGFIVFADTALCHPGHLIALGLLISLTGQCGDLMLSSIKRDLGIKDMAATIPGHGGLLDRFDSLLLAAPAVFHYVGHFKADGIGLDMPTRVITGGGS